ncbi:hypothetical protein OM076_30350 [Solirubrobacter ginsenosidimutans]|uniref:Uncharacterized protein n=1 Tax=Solirubrobacter ginsenosidimutans TaxID=490573 RepID=A0A9X3S2H5_9ACTN|nr:hypothetical protein [Solirubrobacter ginsenosidimutans]MDA0164610.1 hypothetical protein [Solirubrobacter ginsenosidimutans]
MWEGSDLKLQRAREHIEAADELVDAYLDNGACTVVRTADERTGRTELRVQITAPPPARLALVIGDAVHNLRAALDHVVFEAALSNSVGTLSPAAEEALMFPIRDKPPKGGWEQVVKDRLPGVPPPVCAVIEAEQPFRWTTSEHPTAHLFRPLWRVHDLDRIDKHRTLTVTTAALSHHAFGVHAEKDPEIRFYYAPGRVQDGQLLATYRTDSGATYMPDLNLAIVEGEAELANQTISATLAHLHQHVVWTVHRIRVAATPRDVHEPQPDASEAAGAA